MLKLLLHGAFPYCLDTYESCMSHVIFSETISLAMLKIHRERERENLSVSNRYFCTDPWQYQRLRGLYTCLLFIIVWRRAFVKISGPGGFRNKHLPGAYTHPFQSWICSSEALSTCLFIYMVAWFFPEVLSYRAIPVKITPELSINTLAQKFQAVNKSVKFVTCWSPIPLLLKYRGLQRPDLLWGRATLQQLLPCCLPQEGSLLRGHPPAAWGGIQESMLQ